MKVLNTQQMQRCDRAAIDEYGIAELVLMENAGVQVVECIEEIFGDLSAQRFGIVCGKGNNGGDGLVIARHLHASGAFVRAYLFAAADALVGSVAANHAIAIAAGVEVVEVADAEAWAAVRDELATFDGIVDALFGTGVTGALRGYFGDVVHAVNDVGATVIAVDLPSGLSASSGDIEGPVIVADHTVTFAAPKVCHVLAPACECVGELTVVDIGIPDAALDAVEGALELITPAACAGALGARNPDTHKGSYGRVLIVGGAPGMAGAPALTAQAALRGGAGLVHVAAPETVAVVVGGLVAEALVHAHPANDHGALGAAAADGLRALIDAADVLAIGPGIGSGDETAALVKELVAASSIPVVVDADGLNAFAGDLAALQGGSAPCVLTPHPGEAGRLLGCSAADVQADRVAAVTRLARDSDAVVALKGHRTLVCDRGGVVSVNPTGNPGMATGGAGDVLTGLIAALIAQGIEPYRATCIGVYLHGKAGDIASEVVGEISLIASDIIAALPQALISSRVGEP